MVSGVVSGDGVVAQERTRSEIQNDESERRQLGEGGLARLERLDQAVPEDDGRQHEEADEKGPGGHPQVRRGSSWFDHATGSSPPGEGRSRLPGIRVDMPLPPA